jgi:hypothetical protein
MGVRETSDALKAALETVGAIVVYRDFAPSVDAPAAVIGPPRMTWETVSAEPTDLFFPVFLVVRADEYAMDALWDLLPQVSAALDATDFASVSEAIPGTFPVGGVDLPAYELTVDANLI